ncbi:hypothetical protein DPMN_191747 [Dreissena polymorpha]|uniref:Uncharacterized protein n=1 Tax=Dreissena polymorpha TaxID=45954 RepID=A0A9D4B6H5_DREPO|nr:hypothetical protein DPMN_191747 [Dreissena polymorpha]
MKDHTLIMNASNFSYSSKDMNSSYQTSSWTVYKFMYEYVLPIIVFVGLVGNLTSIYLILYDKQMRKVSSSVFSNVRAGGGYGDAYKPITGMD